MFEQLLLLMSGSVEISPGLTLHNLAQRKESSYSTKISGDYLEKEISFKLYFQVKNSNSSLPCQKHITTTANSDLLNMPGFQFIHKDRGQVGEEGGVAIYISDDIKWRRRTDLETEEIECIWLEIEIFKGKNFLVGCMIDPLIH